MQQKSLPQRHCVGLDQQS